VVLSLSPSPVECFLAPPLPTAGAGAGASALSRGRATGQRQWGASEPSRPAVGPLGMGKRKGDLQEMLGNPAGKAPSKKGKGGKGKGKGKLPPPPAVTNAPVASSPSSSSQALAAEVETEEDGQTPSGEGEIMQAEPRAGALGQPQQTPHSVTFQGTDEVELESEFMEETESMKRGRQLINYARENNLAISLETMQPVVLPAALSERLAACFPYPTQEQLTKYKMATSQPTPLEFAAALSAAAPAGDALGDVTELKAFLLSNRHFAGDRAIGVLSHLRYRAQAAGNLDEARRLLDLSRAVMRAESALTAPFRQAMKLAEERIAPFMGSTEVLKYGGVDAVETTCSMIVLKSVVAEWEERYRELAGEEPLPMSAVLDCEAFQSNRVNQDRTAKITAAVQQMGTKFSCTDALMSRVIPEARFLEIALPLSTTSDVREAALKQFCPAENMTPEELRLRLRCLLVGLEGLTRQSYCQLQIAVAQIYASLVEGTPEGYNIYADNKADALKFDPYDLSGGMPWRNMMKKLMTTEGYEAKDVTEQGYDDIFDALSGKRGGPKGEQEEEAEALARQRAGWLYLPEEDGLSDFVQDTDSTLDNGSMDWTEIDEVEPGKSWEQSFSEKVDEVGYAEPPQDDNELFKEGIISLDELLPASVAPLRPGPEDD
jgi:hypothetical protein